MRAVEAIPRERGKALETLHELSPGINPRLAEGVLQCSMLWASAPEGQCPCAKEDKGKGGGGGTGGEPVVSHGMSSHHVGRIAQARWWSAAAVRVVKRQRQS